MAPSEHQTTKWDICARSGGRIIDDMVRHEKLTSPNIRVTKGPILLPGLNSKGKSNSRSIIRKQRKAQSPNIRVVQPTRIRTNSKVDQPKSTMPRSTEEGPSTSNPSESQVYVFNAATIKKLLTETYEFLSLFGINSKRHFTAVEQPKENEAEEDVNYHQGFDQKDLYCEVCDKRFRRVKPFLFHHRRHSSSDHYQCPTCLQGFTTLKACYAHELRQHQKRNSAGAKSSAINEESSAEEDESVANGILPSNSYQLYRGPPVNHAFECHDIQKKYGRRDRYQT